MTSIVFRIVLAAGILSGGVHAAPAQEPSPVNPFASTNSQRDDAIPGCIELSDGSIHPGLIHLTRDKRLKIADDKAQRQREVPLSAVKQITCTVAKEWMEKEWKFKELTNDEKMSTGRSYPAGEYEHTITLNDGQTITGSLSAIVYLQPGDNSQASGAASQPEAKTEQFILNKRNKGEIGQDLHSLVYVKSIKLGKDAFAEGLKKSAEHTAKPKQSAK